MDSQPCFIWIVTWGINSDLEGPLSLLMPPTFLEEALKWSENFLVVPVWAGLIYPIQHTWGYALLPPFCWVCFTACLAALRSVRSWPSQSSPWLSFFFFRILREDCFVIASDVTGSLLPYFCCYRCNMKKVFLGFFSSLWQYFKRSRLFSCSVRRRG